MASTYLSRSVSTTGNRRTWTFSAWVKKSNVTQQYQNMFAAGSNNIRINFSNQNIWVYDYNGSGFDFYLVTNRLFRDTNAFYHIVVAVDTTQATSSDRVKLYINGVQETSFSTETYPSQNHDTEANTSGQNNVIGTDAGSLGNNSLDGSMAHVHWIDGTAYDASTFGETDATTGIWKPKTAPSVTYGTNGFFLKFENSGAFGTDSSGNGNNFTVNGTMTQTIDTPSNVFATWNSLIPNSSITYLNGNTRFTTDTSGNFRKGRSTLGMSSGKYYCEMKPIYGDDYTTLGIEGIDDAYSSTQATFQSTNGLSLGEINSGSSGTSAIRNSSGIVVDSLTGGYGDNDIVGIALDLDNGYVYWSVNGTWINSGDPTSGATGTGGVAINSGVTYCFSGTVNGVSSAGNLAVNFGNGYFGTTAVASAQNPDDGIGIFEHSVPNGYKALCTKSINSQEYD